MPTVRHDAFFRQHPVFTGEELAEHLSSTGRVGARTQESLLAYHTKRGRLVRVRRGLFAVIPPGADPNSYPVDPYRIASKLTPGRRPLPPHGPKARDSVSSLVLRNALMSLA